MRVARRVVGLGLLAMLGAPAAAAQTAAERPPGPYVIDLRVATSALPQDASYFPPVPIATAIPAYGLGIDVGAHVYLLTVGPARVGVGADLFRVAGRTSPATPTGTSGSTPPPRRTVPEVETRVRMFTPQLSVNFGSAAGWSYISVGVGQISARTATSEFTASTAAPASVTPARTRESAALQTINVGGGARWFTGAHVAFSFDVRFHKAAARTKNEISTAAATLVTASAGISLK